MDPRDALDVDPRDHDEEESNPSPIVDTDPREREADEQCKREIQRDHGWDARDRDPEDPRDVLLEHDLRPKRERRLACHPQLAHHRGERRVANAFVASYRRIDGGPNVVASDAT